MATSGTPRIASAQQVIDCFRRFDKEGSGLISREVLQKLLGTLSCPKVQRLLHSAPTDNVGRIRYVDFIISVMSDKVYNFDPDDTNSIAQLVVGVLPAWKDVDPERIAVRRVSQHGGASFRVSADEAASGLQPVLFKQRGLGATQAGDVRRQAATEALAAHGLAKKRLAQGPAWQLEPWLGASLGEHRDFWKPEQPNFGSIGELLAKIHAVPVSWYDAHRCALHGRIPERLLPPAQQGSHIHKFLCCPASVFPGDLTDDGVRRWAFEDFFAPHSSAGRRLVTCHGDFHQDNILVTKDGLIAIDFDFTCVAFAVLDLALFIHIVLTDYSVSSRRMFIKAYLQASKQDYSPAAVDELLFDAEVARLGASPQTPLWDLLPRAWPRVASGLASDLYGAYKAFVAKARGSAELRAEVIERGIFAAAQDREETLASLQQRVDARIAIATDSGLPEDVRAGRWPHWMLRGSP